MNAFDPANATQRRAGCAGLQVLTAALRIYSGRGVPPAQAAAWIGDANRIRAVIGC